MPLAYKTYFIDHNNGLTPKIIKMKNKNPFIKGLATIFLVCLVFTSCTQGPTDVSNEIREANKSFMEAFNNGDAEAVALHYTEEGSLYPPNSDVVTGHESIATFWGGAMSMGIEEVILETNTAEGYGNFAMEEGSYKLFAPGAVLVDHGKYFVTWEKQADGWKLVKDIWNTSNPPIPRANENDTILIATSKIKPENFDRLMDFANEHLMPPFEEYFPESKAKSRFFKNLEPDEDGYVIVHYFADPYSVIDTHTIRPILSKKYDEAEVERLVLEFSEIIADQTWTLAVQLAW
jgi:ketosteroid isomerase-like protein